MAIEDKELRPDVLAKVSKIPKEQIGLTIWSPVRGVFLGIGSLFFNFLAFAGVMSGSFYALALVVRWWEKIGVTRQDERGDAEAKRL